mgnify:CR=1 FL=1
MCDRMPQAIQQFRERDRSLDAREADGLTIGRHLFNSSSGCVSGGVIATGQRASNLWIAVIRQSTSQACDDASAK